MIKINSNNLNQSTSRVNPIQLEKYLKGINYPASKEDIINTAEKNGADQNVVATLQKLPERTYEGPVGVSEEVGKFE